MSRSEEDLNVHDNNNNISSSSNSGNAEMNLEGMTEKRYKGVRRRRWGKWVSEIRVPGTRERLWLGSYRTPEAAAVAHDTALFCLHGCSRVEGLNFPMALPVGLSAGMLPKAIQKAASQAGTAVDSELMTQMLGTEPDDQIHHHHHHHQHNVIQSHDHVESRSFWEGEENDEYGCSKMNEGGVGGSREGEGMTISVDDMEICL